MNQRVLRALSVIRAHGKDQKAVKATIDACAKWMTNEEFQALKKASGS